ncbi:hypothetical protein MMC25_003008 [Agyrium rufum]|nr:hypothetical protein [Agyrium rufum]
MSLAIPSQSRQRLSLFPHASLNAELSLALRRSKPRPVQITLSESPMQPNYTTDSPLRSGFLQVPHAPPPTPADAQIWGQQSAQYARKASIVLPMAPPSTPADPTGWADMARRKMSLSMLTSLQ